MSAPTIEQVMITGDNLDALRTLPADCADLVYLDPPFNKNKTFAAPANSRAAGAEFHDVFTAADAEPVSALASPALCAYLEMMHRFPQSHGGEATHPYLCFMANRLLECQRVLKPTGSIYLHCDDTTSHQLRTVMDAIFGANHFLNAIVWCYTGPQRAHRWYPRKHDVILFYSKTGQHVFHKDAIRVPSKWNALGGFSKAEVAKRNRGKVPEDWWPMTFGPNSKERYGYPTQKPLALLRRIILASSDPGDLVLDPFSGGGTTLIAAEQLQRRWVGMDVSPHAYRVLQTRLSELHLPTEGIRHIGTT